MSTRKPIFLALALLLLSPALGAAQELRLANLRPMGLVQVEVYADAASWQRGREPAQRHRLPARDVSQVLKLEGLPPGRYAIRAWQPALAASQPPLLPMGLAMPRRGYSRLPLAHRAPPSFDSAAVELGEGRRLLLRLNPVNE
jgi:uncharacterized protein (DUF2141 family)